MPAESEAAAGGSGSSGGGGSVMVERTASTSRTLMPGAGVGAAGTQAPNAPAMRATASSGAFPAAPEASGFFVIFRGMVTA